MPKISRRDIIAATAAGAIESGATEVAPTVEKDNLATMTATVATVSQFTAFKFTKSICTVFMLGFHKPGMGAFSVRRVNSDPLHKWKFRSKDRFLANGSTDATNGGWWEGVPVNSTVDVLQFGAKADWNGTTGADDYAAFANMFAYAKSQNILPSNAASRIICFIPPAEYYCGSTITIDFPVIIDGGGHGTGHVNSAQIHFPALTTGFIFSNGIGTNSSGSSMNRVTLQGPPVDNSDTTHGIICRSIMNFSYVNVNAFAGDGFLFDGSGLAATPAALCDQCSIYNCSAESNRMSGFHLIGMDSNVICFYSCNAISNGRWGFNDECFLGSTFVSCHTRDNGFQSSQSGATTAGANCNYSGATWTVRPSRGVTAYPAATTTTPGTDDNVWYQLAPYTMSAFPTWTPGQVWNDGGSYKSQSGNNGESVFVGCYAEGGQAIYIEPGATIFGGQISVYAVPTGIYPTVYGRSSISTTSVSSQDNTAALLLGAQSQQNTCLQIAVDSFTFPFRLKSLSTNGKDLGFAFDWANQVRNKPIEIWGGHYTVANGGRRDTPVTNRSFASFVNGIMLQDAFMGSDTHAPTSGTWIHGDTVFAWDTSARIMYKCVADGSPGTWVPLMGCLGAATVSRLPSASQMGAGARGFVTDANATTFLSIVAGGGSNKVPVVSDGTNWLIG